MDLEKLLQQYGEDQRQQQQAEKQIRRIARRQRRMLTGAVCVLLVATVTIWTVQRRDMVAPDEGMLVAQNAEPVVPEEEPAVLNEESLPATPERSYSMRGDDAVLVAKNRFVDTTPTEIFVEEEMTPIVAEAEPDRPEVDIQSDLPLVPPVDEQQVVERDNIFFLDPIDPPASQMVAENNSRFHFMASVGASTMSQFSEEGVQMQGGNGFMPTDNNSPSYMAFTPLNTFSANTGMSYAVVQKERLSTSVGVAVSGQVQQGTVTSYVLDANAFAQGDELWVVSPDGKEYYNTFSLYAGIPLIFNMQPLGANKVGWNLSLTPLHALFSSSRLGSNQSNAVVLNPWRMTLGVGVTLPRRFPRRVSLTANLLPLYTSSSIHELGIEIGF